jgi:hypothetical protein
MVAARIAQVDEYLPWELSGTYLEACNCDAICPCRAIGGRKGGRSTYGVCMGALSWSIERGRAGEVDLAGLGVVLALRYSDDEPGSPWRYFLYLDERGDDSQRQALEAIFTGRMDGTADEQFPWVWKASDRLGVRASSIQIDHTPGHGRFSAGDQVSVKVGGPAPDQEPVTCVIPGHHRNGREVLAELIEVADDGLSFEFQGRCGYESTFEYSSAKAS